MAAPLVSGRMRFFEHVAAIAAMNPFSDERDTADRLLAGTHLEPRSAHLLEQLTERVGAEVMTLKTQAGDKPVLDLVSGQERSVLGKALLFHEFHALAPHLDAFIAAGESAPGLIVPRFAEHCLASLADWGFRVTEALHYLALMYQMRRAYFFINQALQGEGARVRALRAQLWNCIFSHDSGFFDSTLRHRMENFSVLILGETGTGKSSAARAIGLSQYVPWDPVKKRFSEHPSALFRPVNLVEYPETLLESALFGHRKGSFTGAIADHLGLFAQTQENSLVFLDEIGEASLAVQVKLLRVLQERVFSPVGDSGQRPFRGRIVAATNQPMLESLIRGNGMRLDLFFRLCTDVVEFPPLRLVLADDAAELERLVTFFAERIIGAQPAKAKISEVMQHILSAVGNHYDWPGNSRELEQRVRQVLLTGRSTLPKFSFHSAAGNTQTPAGLGSALLEAARQGLDADALVQRYCSALYAEHRSYEAVARIVRLDWRTVRKYCERETGKRAV